MPYRIQLKITLHIMKKNKVHLQRILLLSYLAVEITLKCNIISMLVFSKRDCKAKSAVSHVHVEVFCSHRKNVT